MISINFLNKIHSDFFKNGIVFLEGPFESDDLIKIANSFGDLQKKPKHYQEGVHSLGDYVQIVGSSGVLKRDFLEWHIDGSQYKPEEEHGGTLLYNVQNGELVDTLFVDMKQVYNFLTEDEINEMRDVIVTYSAKVYLYQFPEKQKNAAEAKKPLIQKHPVTNEEMLYFSPATMIGSNKEFNSEYLKSLINKFQYNYKHTKNGLVIFDNYRVLHKRYSFEGERILHRVRFNYSRCLNEY